MSLPLPSIFSVGTDNSVTIYNNAGGAPVTLDGKRVSQNAEDQAKLLKSSPIDGGGLPDHRVLPDGWQGTIEVDKSSPYFGQLYAMMEAAYYNGLPQTFFTITETIRNPNPAANGAIMERWQYTMCVFHGYKPGTWTKDSQVKASITFSCQQRIDLLA